MGHISGAAKVFELIEEKDIVAWSAMLAGYAQTGDTEGAVEVFLQLTKEVFRQMSLPFPVSSMHVLVLLQQWSRGNKLMETQ